MKISALIKKAPLIKKAHRQATLARKKAYAPYSKFKVGAAVLCADGTVFSGCNVENASYGACLCAERVAIFQAVACGQTKFAGIVVVTDAKTPAVPCAMCLQVMAEFFPPEAKILIGNTKKITLQRDFVSVLPLPFGRKQLQQAKRGN